MTVGSDPMADAIDLSVGGADTAAGVSPDERRQRDELALIYDADRKFDDSIGPRAESPDLTLVEKATLTVGDFVEQVQRAGSTVATIAVAVAIGAVAFVVWRELRR